jgi:cytochrome P450
VEGEAVASHMAADAIFRVMFSMPIEAPLAAIYRDFRAFQRAQPLLNAGAFLPLPRWLPRGHGRAARAAARRDQGADRGAGGAAGGGDRCGHGARRRGHADHDDAGPGDGAGFAAEEMVDQVAIFFLAGHETSASALAWALYLLATHPEPRRGRRPRRAPLPQAPGFSRASPDSASRATCSARRSGSIRRCR